MKIANNIKEKQLKCIRGKKETGKVKTGKNRAGNKE